MIVISRLDGSSLVVNADLIETIEHHGDTVVTLVSGTRFVVREGVEEIIDAVRRFRASVLDASERAVPLAADRSAATAAAPQGGRVPVQTEPAKVIPMDPGRRGSDTE